MVTWITNAYLDKCLEIIARFDEFSILHIYMHENSEANDLAQQASSYNVSNKNFSITKTPMCVRVQNLESLSVLGVETGLISSPNSLTGMPKAQIGPTNSSTSLIGLTVPDNPVLENLACNGIEHDKADVIDWRRHIIDYLKDPSHKVDRKIWWFAFKFTLIE
jgi:hypothetical protein